MNLASRPLRPQLSAGQHASSSQYFQACSAGASFHRLPRPSTQTFLPVTSRTHGRQSLLGSLELSTWRHRGTGYSHRLSAGIAAKASSAASSSPQGSDPANPEKPSRILRFKEGLLDSYHKTVCMIRNSVSLLSKGFLVFFLLHELSALLSYFMQRISHRALNEVSLRTLSLPEGAIPNLWYAVDRPEIMNFDTGYQQWSYVFFLVLLPLSALIRSLAAGATIYLCERIRKQEAAEAMSKANSSATTKSSAEQEVNAADGDDKVMPAQNTEEIKGMDKAGEEIIAADKEQDGKPADGETTTVKPPQEKKIGWFGQVRAAMGSIWSLRGQIGAIWLQLWIVELLVTIRVLPLEALSYVVITLPFTLPRILNLQLAVASAVKEGKLGNAALRRSAELVKGFRWPVLFLLVGTLGAARVVETAQSACLAIMPVRIFADIPELPLLVSVVAYIGNRIINRIRDILPFVAYELGKEANGKSEDDQVSPAEGTA